MYAIVEDRGQQVRVEEGKTVRIDLLEKEEGESVTFDRVLFVSGDGASLAGTPTIDGAKVEATVEGEVKGKKTHAVWFRRTRNSRKRTGHRPRYTLVRINGIQKGS